MSIEHKTPAPEGDGRAVYRRVSIPGVPNAYDKLIADAIKERFAPQRDLDAVEVAALLADLDID